MTPISVVIITYNEEKNIKRCIESVKSIADDIVVVDSFSADRTGEIAKNLGARVIGHEFKGHIEQKNWAITQARYSHILSLDADEALSEKLTQSIAEIKNNWEFDGYYFNRLTNYCGKWIKHCGWYPDKKLRLWNSTKGEWTGTNPHDRYELKEGARVKYIYGDLLHYSYFSIEQHIDQVNKFTTIGAKEAIDKGKRSTLLKIIVKPLWKFIRDYFVKLGLLDGYYGLVISVISAHATFVKYLKMRELQKKVFKKMTEPNHIILSRTDSIGDVILTLPLAGFLKKKFPRTKISFIGRSYTEAIINMSKHVDKFIDWDEFSKKNKRDQKYFFKKLGADWIIHIFPNKEIARLAKRVKIKNRIGTSHRTFHWLTCNKRVDFSRKDSELHESQLNFELLAPLGINDIPELHYMKDFYGFVNLPEPTQEMRYLVDKKKFNVILHPKSQGSAREWGLFNFDQLIKNLPADKFKIFITGTHKEGRLMKEFLEQNKDRVKDLTGKFKLNELVAFISLCDGLVAASTGPLHIAAALGKKAIGLYAPMRPIHPGRWAPIGKNVKVLVLDEYCEDCRLSGDCRCIKSIPPLDVVEALEI